MNCVCVRVCVAGGATKLTPKIKIPILIKIQSFTTFFFKKRKVFTEKKNSKRLVISI